VSDPTCATCPYYAVPKHQGERGECRYHSPILFGSVSYWPKVLATDWCGCHPALETLRTPGSKAHMIARRHHGGKPADASGDEGVA
jgi:hypothetical protein